MSHPRRPGAQPAAWSVHFCLATHTHGNKELCERWQRVYMTRIVNHDAIPVFGRMQGFAVALISSVWDAIEYRGDGVGQFRCCGELCRCGGLCCRPCRCSLRNFRPVKVSVCVGSIVSPYVAYSSPHCPPCRSSILIVPSAVEASPQHVWSVIKTPCLSHGAIFPGPVREVIGLAIEFPHHM